MPTAGTSEIISEIQLECRRLAVNPPTVEGKKDRYIPLFANAVDKCFEYLPEPQQQQLATAINTKEEKGPFGSENVLNHMLRGCQMRFRKIKNSDDYDSSFPFETQEEWDERVSELVFDEKEFKILTNDMIIWNVGSDVETRAAGIKLVAHTVQKEQVSDVNKPFKILNIGSARDHSLAMLGGNVAFPGVGVAGYEQEPEKQRFLQERINELLAKEISLGDCYGVDLWQLKDPLWSEFLESCRFYPSELLDPVKRYMYQYLEEVRDADPRLHHVEADYGVDNIEFGTRFNMVAFLTSLYQSHPEKQRSMFDKAKNDGQLIMVQDFCNYKDFSKNMHPMEQLEFLGPTTEPFKYGVFIYDSLKPDLGLQLLGYWNNGRCEIFMPSPLFIKLLKQLS